MIHDPNNQKRDKYGRSWYKFCSNYILIDKKPIRYINKCAEWIKKGQNYIKEKQYTFRDENNI